MRHVSPDEIAGRIGIASLLPAMREALKAEAEGRVEVPLRAGWQLGGGALGMLAMPARSQELGLAVFKLLTLVDANRARGLPGVMGELTLLKADTGEAIARLPAEEITLLRTAACSAVATELLAPPDADSLALFGSGPQAAHHAEAMLAVRPIARVLICGRDAARAEKLADSLQTRFGLETAVGPDPKRLRDAAIICTATNAREPLFETGDVRADAHINAIGAYRPDMRELPAALLRRQRSSPTAYPPVAREAGDLLAAFGSPDAGRAPYPRHRRIGGPAAREPAKGPHGL